MTLKFQWNAFRRETRRGGNHHIGEELARKLYFLARGVRARLAGREESGAAFYLEKTAEPTCEQRTKSPRDVPLFRLRVPPYGAVTND